MFVAFGVDTKILVKLLDAGQRLPINAHPSGAWAQVNIGARHGKAEAWYLLHAGDVYLGLTQDATLEKLKSLVDAQDVETMLNLMHRVPVKAHQTVYVPHGILHAIGKGILMAEIQETEDLSILLDWRDFNIDGRVDGHVGLGFERALQAVKIRARSEKEILTLVTNENATRSVLVTESNKYFLHERVLVNGSSTRRAGFALVIIVDGMMEMTLEHGNSLQLRAGSTVVVPNASGSLLLVGNGQVLFARPPVPV
jgi:mannose-6-phosphate isomerase